MSGGRQDETLLEIKECGVKRRVVRCPDTAGKKETHVY